MNESLEKTDKLAVFYVATLQEFDSSELWSSLSNYLNNFPSQEYSFDFYIFMNRLVINDTVALFVKTFSNHANVNKIEFIDLDLTSEDDVFWYPWSKTPRPVKMPRLGYTAGANVLFFNSLNFLLKHHENYENFLMLEADTFPMKKFWADSIIEFIGNNDFLIAGSKYKGVGKEHYQAKYKDHLNGVAIYKNDKKLKQLINEVEKFIEKSMPESGYYNFDVAINDYITQNKKEDYYKLLDTEIFINISDPRDKFITSKSILEAYENCLIIHQKPIPFYQQLTPDILKYDETKEELLTFYAQPKCASEYVMNCNLEFLLNFCEYNKYYPLCLVYCTKNNSRIIIHGYTKEFELFDKSMFSFSFNNYSGVTTNNLFKIIESGYFYPFSAAIDQRSTNSFDYSVFSEFSKICQRLNVSQSYYSFSRDPIEIASSMFTSFENMNKSLIVENRNESLYDYLINHSDKSFIAQNFIGKQDLNNFEFKYLFSLLENISFYDLSLVDDVMFNMFRKNKKINNTISFKNIFINHTVGKISYHKDLTSDSISTRVENKFKLAKKIYNVSTIRSIQNNKVPIFLHVPRCGGTYVNNVFTYFLKKFSLEQNMANVKNFKRLHVLMEDGETFFIVYCVVENDGFHSDPEIFFKKGNPLYAECDYKTFAKYVNDFSLDPLAASTTLSGRPIDSFEIIKNTLDRLSYDYAPFMFLRDPRSQMESILRSRNLNVSALSDSWVLKKLFNYNPSLNIKDIEYLSDVSDFLIDENVLIRDISLIEETLSDILFECFNLKLPRDIIENSKKNENNNNDKISSIHKRAITQNIKWNKAFYESIIY